jgi:hypothetical protein
MLNYRSASTRLEMLVADVQPFTPVPHTTPQVQITGVYMPLDASGSNKAFCWAIGGMHRALVDGRREERSPAYVIR